MKKFAFVFSERQLGTVADCGLKATVEATGLNAADAFTRVLAPDGRPCLYNVVQRKG